QLVELSWSQMHARLLGGRFGARSGSAGHLTKREATPQLRAAAGGRWQPVHGRLQRERSRRAGGESTMPKRDAISGVRAAAGSASSTAPSSSPLKRGPWAWLTATGPARRSRTGTWNNRTPASSGFVTAASWERVAVANRIESHA